MYSLKDFVMDLLDTEDVVSELNSCNESWANIAGSFIEKNPGLLITEDEYQEEILTPYLDEVSELLESYDVGDFKLSFVEALSSGCKEVLVWCFKDTSKSLYVYSVGGKWTYSEEHPVLVGDLNPSMLSPNKHWVVNNKAE